MASQYHPTRKNDISYCGFPAMCCRCGHSFHADSEDRICIDFFAECMNCRFASRDPAASGGTPDDYAAIRMESHRRQEADRPASFCRVPIPAIRGF